jgi:hypothetical protein
VAASQEGLNSMSEIVKVIYSIPSVLNVETSSGIDLIGPWNPIPPRLILRRTELVEVKADIPTASVV